MQRLTAQREYGTHLISRCAGHKSIHSASGDNWVIRTQLETMDVRACTDFPHSLIVQKVSDFHIFINLLYNYATHTPMIVSV